MRAEAVWSTGLKTDWRNQHGGACTQPRLEMWDVPGEGGLEERRASGKRQADTVL